VEVEMQMRSGEFGWKWLYLQITEYGYNTSDLVKVTLLVELVTTLALELLLQDDNRFNANLEGKFASFYE
jgi:hypothetical protein